MDVEWVNFTLGLSDKSYNKTYVRGKVMADSSSTVIFLFTVYNALLTALLSLF